MTRWCLPHGIKGITDQVHQDLLNLDRIYLDQWQVLGQRCFYLAGISHCIRPDDMRYMLVISSFRLIRRRVGSPFLIVLRTLLDDIVSATPVCLHVDQDLTQRCRIFLTPVDKPHSSIRIADDARERLIQFMGE